MNKFLLLAIACVLGATACSRLREPTDAQLGTLLRSDNANPADANAMLDGLAVECLRAWSEDKELQKGLPVRTAGEDGRKSCRSRLDTWIADPARNPDKFSFADVSAPKTVRRAMELQEARRAAAMASAKREAVPAQALPPQQGPALKAPDPTIDLGPAGVALQEAESLCTQTQEAAKVEGADPRLVRYSQYCMKSLNAMRKSMEGFVKSGNKAAVDALVTNANNKSNAAKDLLALPPVKQ